MRLRCLCRVKCRLRRCRPWTRSRRPARILLGFADADVNGLLGLDAAREGSLALVPLGTGAPPPPAGLPLPSLTLSTIPLSSREVDYPLVREAYLGSSLATGTAARAWVAPPPHPKPATREHDGPSYPLAPLTSPPASPLGTVILRRGSTRQFDRGSIGFAEQAPSGFARTAETTRPPASALML